MLKIIAGVLEPTYGSVRVKGQIAPLIELGAGFDMDLSARENIYLNGALLGYSKRFIEQHFDEIVRFAEIEQFLDMPLKNYSSGMIARIAFSIATVIIPDVLIVDEALSVGDFLFQEKCEARIHSLINEHGVTVLFVSHSIDQVERVCQKAVWIEKGELKMKGNVKRSAKPIVSSKQTKRLFRYSRLHNTLQYIATLQKPFNPFNLFQRAQKLLIHYDRFCSAFTVLHLRHRNDLRKDPSSRRCNLRSLSNPKSVRTSEMTR